MLNRKISRDREVAAIANDLGCAHALFFTWAISHLDRDGRLDADPEVLRGMVVPLIGKIDGSVIASTIELAGEFGLIDVYEDDRGRRFMTYPKFAANQVGLRHNREPASDFPDPEDCRKISGSVPEDIRQPSGRDPAEGNRREGKGIEGKGTKEGARELAESVPSVVIDDIWSWYKRHHSRAGKKMGAKEAKLCRARLKDFSPDDIKLAIDGYHRSPYHCGQNDTGTKYQSLELILRDNGKVQRGIEFATEVDGPVLTEQSRQTISAAESFAKRKMAEDDQQRRP